MFEKRSTGTGYDDHRSPRARHDHPGRHNFPGWVSHQQRAGLAMAGEVMSTCTVAFYDYAEQILKAQRQFADSVLGAGGPMLDVWRDVMSSDANEGESANQMDARGNQRHEGSTSSRKNERDNHATQQKTTDTPSTTTYRATPRTPPGPSA